MRLKELTIAGFRGFKAAKTIPLDADIIVIHGPNGSGKSSIVEAIEWLLLDDISRHERAKSPSEYQEALRNIHCGRNEPTFVEAKLVLDNKELTIKREYRSAKRHAILVDDEEIEDLSEIGIEIESYTRPILAQGEIKSFVDSEQKERHEEIAYILGLDVLGQLRDSLMALRNNMKKDQTIGRSIRLRDAKLEDLRQYSEFNSLITFIEASQFNYNSFIDALYLSVKDICGISVGTLSHCQEKLKAERNKIVTQSPSLTKLNEITVPGDITPTTELLKALTEIATICNKLESTADKMIGIGQARFLSDGLKLVSDSMCPFCLKQTVTQQRKIEIKDQLKKYDDGIKLEDELRDRLSNFSYQWSIVIQDLQIKAGIQASVKAALDEALEVLGSTTDTKALQAFHDDKVPELRSQVDNINTGVKKFEQSIVNLLDHKSDLSLKQLISLNKTVKKDIENVTSNVYTRIGELTSLKSRMLSKTPGMSSEAEKKLKMIIAVESLIENVDNVKLAGVFNNRLLEIDKLQANIEIFERKRMEEMLCDLSGEILHYYEKLNPGEPIRFTRLAVASPGQRRVRIEGESFGKDINPVSCFSEAHVNCLGISLYFCQRVGRNPQFKFFVLDDPVQSMDEQHIEYLIDVLKEVSQKKQLLVLTHQKELLDLLDDVFNNANYFKYSCGSYTKEGPQIETDIESIKKNLQLAKTYCRGSKDDRINRSAACLRKAMEAAVKDILIDRYKVSRKSLRIQRVRLSSRLTQLEGLGFDNDDIVSMRTILPIVDPPHHDDPNWDVQPQRIERAIKIIDSLSKKCAIGQYHISRVIVGQVTNYMPKMEVAVVDVKDPFSVNDDLLIEGSNTRIQFKAESIELGHKKIGSAQPGTLVGIKVPQRVRPNDLVYKII